MNLPLRLHSDISAIVPPSFSLSPELFAKVFPFHLAFNGEGKIVQMGEALARVHPRLSIGAPIQPHFRIARPQVNWDYAQICRATHALYVLESIENKMRLKGQMVCVESEQIAFFLGTPAIADFKALKGLGLRLSDFALHDPVTDFLLLLQGQKLALFNAKKRSQELSQKHRVLEESLSKLKATFEATADGILVTDLKGNILDFNQQFMKMWQISPATIAPNGENDRELAFARRKLQHPEVFLTKIRQLYGERERESYDILELDDGRIFECHSRPQWMGSDIHGRVWSFRDITDRQRVEAEIRYQASHDLLTGLPNRRLFEERLAANLADAEAEAEMLAVGFLDLDRFKAINDTLGHAVGDRLLQSVAQRLRSQVRTGDTVARWGGDEFAILLPKLSCSRDALQIAQRLLDAFGEPYILEEREYQIDCSIGIALYPTHGTDSHSLIHHADTALYRVKQQGRNGYQIYNRAMSTEASQRLALENRLYRALERRELLVHYQPQIDVRRDRVVGMETLVRWQHPDGHLISPKEFIPLAEENGLLANIDRWVLGEACRQTKQWQNSGFEDLGIGVNLSKRLFRQPDFVQILDDLLAEHDLDPRYLELEIKESLIHEDLELTSRHLQQLKELGVRLCLDNFGTGYSALADLKQVRFNTLKIDRSLIGDLIASQNNAAIAKATIALAKGLNLTAIAQGVETREQQALLQSWDCDLMQGNWFAPPLAWDAATAFLEGRFSWGDPTRSPASHSGN
ncbi:EAL domain-containing protein [Oxynema aestuarii]|uniref:guanylate cyclase n=1 Tax=Oxynema aestuarii AP17 TaxID=2064643 RepID=A0A6H1U1P9_9CYAN|nr:EAL domain-containing protein [Oxynema aestuarii]QIZ72751.1 EAL domain-containing protein [Oxynema aestuarii AP17]